MIFSHVPFNVILAVDAASAAPAVAPSKPSDNHPRVSECSCEPGNNAPKCRCCPRTRIFTDDRLGLSFG